MTINKLNILFVMCVLVLWPLNLLGNASFGQRVLYVLYPIILVFLALMYSSGKLQLSNEVLVISILIIGLDFLSIIPKMSGLTLDTLLEHSRSLINSIVLLAAYTLGRSQKLSTLHLGKLINFLFFLCLVFIFFQIIIPNSIIIYSINPRPILHSLGIQIGGPFIWSYAFGVLLMIVFGLNIYRLLNQKITFSGIAFIMVLITLTVFTQSKSVYLSCLIVLILITVETIGVTINGSILRRILVAFILLICASTYLFMHYADVLGNIMRFLDFLITKNIDASTQTRLNQLLKIDLSTFLEYLFGAPKVDYIIENNYGYKLANFGIIGLSFHFFLIFYLVLLATRINRFMPCAENFSFVCLTICLPIFNLGSSPLEGPKIGYLLLTLIGLWLACYENHKITEREDLSRVR